MDYSSSNGYYLCLHQLQILRNSVKKGVTKRRKTRRTRRTRTRRRGEEEDDDDDDDDNEIFGHFCIALK